MSIYASSLFISFCIILSFLIFSIEKFLRATTNCTPYLLWSTLEKIALQGEEIQLHWWGSLTLN